MIPHLVLGISALLFTLAFTPACRALCRHLGWVWCAEIPSGMKIAKEIRRCKVV
jgi:hypothetical protein